MISQVFFFGVYLKTFQIIIEILFALLYFYTFALKDYAVYLDHQVS